MEYFRTVANLAQLQSVDFEKSLLISIIFFLLLQRLYGLKM